MKILRIAILAMVLLAIVLGGFLVLSRLNRNKPGKTPTEIVEEDKSPYKNSELQNLVDKLSSPVEEDRRRAERDLAKAGVFANAVLKEAESKASGRALEAVVRLKNKQRFSALNEMDYLSAFPAQSMVAVRLADIRGTVEKSKATPLGKILMRPEFEAERQKRLESLRKATLGGPHQLTYEDVNGQTALAMFSLPGIQTNHGALLELSGLDPQQTYGDLTSRYIKGGGSIYEYENIECVEASVAQMGTGAHTRTGRNLFFGHAEKGTGKEALHTLIQTALGAPSLGGMTQVETLREALGKKADAVAVYNLPQILKEIEKTNPGAEKVVQEILRKIGANKIGFAGNALTILPDQFEDRAAIFLGDAPAGVLAAVTAPAAAKVPLELLDKVPSNAMVAMVTYVDGAKLELGLGELQESIRKANPDDKSLDRGPIEVIRELEKKFGIPPGTLLPHFKGEVGIWLTIAPGFPLILPDLSGTITAEDGPKAEALAELMNTSLAKVPSAKIAKLPYKNRSVYVMTPPPSSGPFSSATFNWSVDGNRVYFSSSTRALQTQINNLEKKSAGLLTRPNVTNALGGFYADDRRGALLFIDMPALLTVTVPFGLVALQSGGQLNDEQKKKLSQLPPAGEMFKEFTPLMAFAGSKRERIETVIHSPIPVSGLAMLLAAFVQFEKK